MERKSRRGHEDDFDAFSVCMAVRKALRDGVDILAAPEAARPYEGWILLSVIVENRAPEGSANAS